MADDTLDTELRAVLSILPDTQQYSKSKGSEQVPGADTIANIVDQQVKVHGIRRHNGSLFYQEHPGGDSAACMAGWGGGGDYWVRTGRVAIDNNPEDRPRFI